MANLHQEASYAPVEESLNSSRFVRRTRSANDLGPRPHGWREILNHKPVVPTFPGVRFPVIRLQGVRPWPFRPICEKYFGEWHPDSRAFFDEILGVSKKKASIVDSVLHEISKRYKNLTVSLFTDAFFGYLKALVGDTIKTIPIYQFQLKVDRAVMYVLEEFGFTDTFEQAGKLVKSAMCRVPKGDEPRTKLNRAQREEIQRFSQAQKLLQEKVRRSTPSYRKSRDIKIQKQRDAKYEQIEEQMFSAFKKKEKEPEGSERKPTIWEGVKASATIATAAGNLMSDEETMRNIRLLSENVQLAATTVNSTAESINSFIEQVQSAFDTALSFFKKHVPTALAFACLLTFALYIYNEWYFPPFASMAIGAVLSRLVGEYIWNSVSGFFRKDARVAEQSGFGSLAGISKIVTTCMVGQALGNSGNKTYLVESVMRRLSSFDRASTGLESMLSSVLKMAEVAINYIRSWFKWEPIRLCRQSEDQIDKVFDTVNQIQHLQMEQPGVDARGRLVTILECHRKIIMYKNLFRGHFQLTRDLDTAMRTCVNLASILKNAAGEGSGYRQMPVSICVYGKPGIGKTMMIQMFAASIFLLGKLMSEGATEEEISRQIFMKPFNSEYFEGYHGQLMYVLDDFCMKKLSPGDSSHSTFDLMTFQSAFKTICNMAVAENKGMNDFVSKIIMMTTNMDHLDQAAIGQVFTCPEALERRVDFHIELMVRPEFQRGSNAERPSEAHMLDYSKFLKELERVKQSESILKSFPWHIWEYFPKTWSGTSSDRVPGTGRPFTELIVKVVRKLEERKHDHDDSMSNISNLLTKRVDTIEEMEASLSDVQEQSGLGESRGMTVCKPGPLCQNCNHKEHKHQFMTEFGWTEQKYNDTFDIMDCTCGNKSLLKGPHIWGNFQEYKELDESQPRTPPPPGSTWDGYTEDFIDMKRLSAMVPPREELPDRSPLEDARASAKGFFQQLREDKRKWSFFSAACVAALALVTVIAIKACCDFAMAAWRWIASYFCPSETIQEQSNRPRVSGIKFKIQQQSGTFEGNHRFIYNNSYKLGVWFGTGDVELFGQIIFLRKDYFLMPHHFRRRMEEAVRRGDMPGNSKLLFRNCASNEEHIGEGIDVDTFLAFPSYSIPDRDIDVCRMTNGCRMARDITKFLVNDNDLTSLGGLPVRLDTARTDKNGTLLDYSERITFMSRSVEVGKVKVKIGPRWADHWLRYDADTEVGDCGAPLCLQRAAAYAHRTWCGIHIGGSPILRQGYSTIVTRQIIDTAIFALEKQTGDPCVKELTLEETVEQCGLYMPAGVSIVDDEAFPFYAVDEDEKKSATFGSFKAIGALTRPTCSPVESQLRPSFIGEECIFEDHFGPCDQIPMKLRPFMRSGELVFPMVEAMKPFAGPLRYIDTKAFATAIRSAMKPFGESTLHHSAAVLTFEEAVLGVPALGLKGIPRNTSVGYPMCLEVRNKTHYFGDGDDYDLTTPAAVQLKTEVLSMVKAMEAGNRLFNLCRGFLKDELRKIGKTSRYIAGTSVHYYILCRMYFGRIVAAQMTKFKDSGMCPGINPYQDWSWLREHVLKPGGKVWDGDFKGFDTSQQPTQLFEILFYINEWYFARGASLKENDVRHLLFLDLAFSKHVVGRGTMATHVVQWQKSLPSGHFLTAFVNSMLSMSCITSAYIATTGDYEFWEHASAATLGDDNLVGASDAVIPLFNQVTTAKHLSDCYGMEYTAGRKGEELKPYLTLGEVVFLQRRFAVKNGHVVCPLRFESFLTNLNYIKKGDAKYQREVLTSMLESAMSELSMHPEDIWKKYAKLIVDLMGRINYQPRYSWLTSTAYLEATLQREDSGWW